jgi:hypothetical protein
VLGFGRVVLGIPALPASVAAPARPSEVALLIVVPRPVIIPWPVVTAMIPVIVRAPRAVIALAVVALAVIGLVIVALVEVVKCERERERDAKADLGLSRGLGCNEQAACCEQKEKRFHALNVMPASEPRIRFLPLKKASPYNKRLLDGKAHECPQISCYS